MTDKEIIEEYPFLEERDWEDKPTGRLILDDLPDGWRKLGLILAKHIKEVLPKEELRTYKVAQVKEKYGELRWYDNSGSTSDLIWAFETLSKHVCVRCGKLKATMIDPEWNLPYCEDCCKKLNHLSRDAEKMQDEDAKLPETLNIHREIGAFKQNIEIDLRPFIKELEEE